MLFTVLSDPIYFLCQPYNAKDQDDVPIKLTHRHGDAGHEELHGVVPLLPLGLGVHVLLLTSVLDKTVQSEQPNGVLKLRRGLQK